MDRFDFVIVGAGAAGEAAAFKARERGATAAIVDRLWFGGSCPHIGCTPSKSLLNSAARHAANPAAYDWPRASTRRDYMINRPPDADEPDDTTHVSALEKAGAVPYRGTARIVGRGRVEIRDGDAVRSVEATNIVVAVGSFSKIPRSPASSPFPPGRIARPPSRGSSRRACSSSAADRPAARLPRSLPVSTSRQ